MNDKDLIDRLNVLSNSKDGQMNVLMLGDGEMDGDGGRVE